MAVWTGTGLGDSNRVDSGLPESLFFTEWVLEAGS